MKLSPLSHKQLDVICNANARLNVLDGPVRSGKTFSSIVRWIEYIKTAPPGDLLMSGKTKFTIRRNVLEDMFKILGARNYSFNSTDGILDTCGRRIYIVGANDDRAEEKIRGMTIAGWYDDETTLKPETFFKQGLARMSVEGAKAFLTTNPDSPYHWFNTEYLENKELYSAGILKRFKFTFDDNLSLSSEYKTSLKKLYTGLWYKRMILGLWVMAEGSIYDMFNDDIHIIHQPPEGFTPTEKVIGIDYGMGNATTFIDIWIDSTDPSQERFFVAREYYHSGRETGRQKTDQQYYDDLLLFATPEHKVLYVDPSASSFIVLVQQKGRFSVIKADNDVVPGIRNVANCLSTGHLYIAEGCNNVKREFASYVWDPKAQKRGEDKPVKENDHTLDPIRYVVRTRIANPGPRIRSA